MKSELYKTLDYSSRDMLNFNFSEKGLEIVSLHILGMIFQEKCYIISTDQISLPHCHNLLRYWSIFVLKLFFNQVVTS